MLIVLSALIVVAASSHVHELLSERHLREVAQELNESTWFVEFYAPWCQHCKSFAPHWQTFAERMDAMRPSVNISVAKVDATSTSAADWVTSLNVVSFPTFVLLRVRPDPSLLPLVTPYHGLRAIDALAAFAVRVTTSPALLVVSSEGNDFGAFIDAANAISHTASLILVLRDGEFGAPSTAILRDEFEVTAALHAEHTRFALIPASLAKLYNDQWARLLDERADLVGGVVVVAQGDTHVEYLTAEVSARSVVRRNRFGDLPCGSEGRLAEVVRESAVLVAVIANVPRPMPSKPAADPAFGREVAAMVSTARQIRRATLDIGFVYVDASDKSHERWLGVVGLGAGIVQPTVIAVRVRTGVMHHVPLSTLGADGAAARWIMAVADDDDDNNGEDQSEVAFAGEGELYVRHAVQYYWRKYPAKLGAIGAVVAVIVLFLAYRFVVRPATNDSDDDDADADDGKPHNE